MSEQRGVVVVERMRGHRVDQRQIGRRRLHAGGRPVRAIVAGMSEPARGDVADRLAPTRHHDGDAVGEAQAHGLDAFGRQPLETHAGHELTDLACESHHAILCVLS